MRKRKVSVRWSPFNHDLIQSIADVAFINENKNVGNFSAALDFCITLLRLNTKFSEYLRYIELKARYDRGDRSSEVVDGVKEFAKIINIMKNVTEKWHETLISI